MANEKTPVVWDDTTNKHRPLGTGEKMGGLDASSLLSSDSGNLLEAGSDGLAYLSGSGMVDPRADNLLEDSANGKLQVTVDRIAEWLDGHPQDAAVLADAINAVSGDEGNVVTAGSDNGAFLSKGAIAAAVAGMTDAQKAQLADAIAARIASDIADGKTIVASGGKLTSDPTNATVAQKAAINGALSSPSGGLVVDPATGTLLVDFENMPTDKFEKMLKSMKMQIPLESNKQLYVNAATGVDDSSDGRGESAAKPFKTIQACVNYATQTFALGTHSIYINVEGGMTYTEMVTLPAYNRTTGSITVRARQDDYPPLVVNPANRRDGTIVYVSGGVWTLRRINISGTFSDAGDAVQRFAGALHLSGGATSVYVYGCSISSVFSGAAPAVYFQVRNISITNGATFSMNVMAGYRNSLSVSKGNATVAKFIHMERSANFVLPAANIDTAGDVYNIECSGSCSYFIDVSTNSTFSVIGGAAHYQHFTGTVSPGAQYGVSSGSGILAPSDGFPGSAEGCIVDSATYSWYKLDSGI